MVEAPRIRIIYEIVRFTKGKTIVLAGGPSYLKALVNIIDYMITKWWYAGKYIYVYLTKKDNQPYVVRTHMLMYGKITLNSTLANIKLKPFLFLELNDSSILRWYLSQIKFLIPGCKIDMIKSNYTICSSKQSILESIIMRKYDISHSAYNQKEHLAHINEGIREKKNDIITDFLLDQKYFPGVGNILQQEALYKCNLLPTTKIYNIEKKTILCLVQQLKNTANLLYESYQDKSHDLPHKSIFQIYHKKFCPLLHKTITKYLGFRNRRTTWCPICQT